MKKEVIKIDPDPYLKLNKRDWDPDRYDQTLFTFEEGDEGEGPQLKISQPGRAEAAIFDLNTTIGRAGQDLGLFSSIWLVRGFGGETSLIITMTGRQDEMDDVLVVENSVDSGSDPIFHILIPHAQIKNRLLSFLNKVWF